MRLREIRRPSPARASLPKIDAAELFHVLTTRMAAAEAAGVEWKLVDRLVAYLLASGSRETGGRWLCWLSIAELSRLAGASARHVQRARSALVDAGVFVRVPMPAPIGAVTLELPRESRIPSQKETLVCQKS